MSPLQRPKSNVIKNLSKKKSDSNLHLGMKGVRKPPSNLGKGNSKLTKMPSYSPSDHLGFKKNKENQENCLTFSSYSASSSPKNELVKQKKRESEKPNEAHDKSPTFNKNLDFGGTSYLIYPEKEEPTSHFPQNANQKFEDELDILIKNYNKVK